MVLRLLLVVALAPLPRLVADDWPCWRGTKRAGISTEKGWLERWPAGKTPRVAWRINVGKGHSCVVVKGDRAYTMGWDGVNDTVFCLDVNTGKILWKRSYPCRTIKQWPGPRATPTVDGEVVYTLGQHGQLRAWATSNGKPIWSVNLPESYNPDGDYGFSWSPLIEGEHLLLAAGTKGLAIRKKDGRFAWGNDGQHGACVSPIPYTHAGRRGVAIVTTTRDRESVRLVGIDPRTGEVQWQHEGWAEKWGAACVDLIVAEGNVFVTTAEQHPRCARFSIDGAKLKLDWESARLPSYTGGCVLVDGSLFGITRGGILKCLDWKTGEERWAQRGFGGFGTLFAANGKLIAQTSDRGEIIVAEASKAGYKELRRAKVFDGDARTFTVPVLSHGRLYCRSYHGEVVCLDLR